MSEYTENAPEKIDLTNLMRDGKRAFRKLWWLILGLIIVFAAKAYLTVSYSYVPQYVASATMAIRSASGEASYIDETTAKQMASIFPYIMKSGLLENAILDDMKLESMPGSLSMTAEEGTNFFTVSATATEAQVAYDLLQAALRQYPEVAQFAVGQIEMLVLDETGVPKNTGRESVVRGSIVNGAAKGLVFGLVIMAVYVASRNTVKKRKELRNIMNLEDIGSVPYIFEKKRKKKASGAWLALNNERISQVYVEAIRKLRIKVMKEMEDKGYKSLLVTSSIPGEGKSTLAVNLAIAMARQGKSVILVDGDVRNPSIAKIIGEKKKHPGLAAVLRKQAPIDKALVKVEIKDGSLLALCGGESDTGMAQALGTERMGKLIKALEQAADVVVIDTPPSELLADAAALAKHVDAAVYVVRCDFTKKSRIRNGIQALSESGINILGYVFNADNSKVGKGYGYGYKNYSGYYGYGVRGNGKKEDSSGRVVKD